MFSARSRLSSSGPSRFPKVVQTRFHTPRWLDPTGGKAPSVTVATPLHFKPFLIRSSCLPLRIVLTCCVLTVGKSVRPLEALVSREQPETVESS